MPQLKTHIAGAQFRKGATLYLKKLNIEYEDAKTRAENPTITFTLEREPQNKYDEHAVKILDPAWDDPAGEGGFLGYIPKDWSYEIARLLKDGVTIQCEYRGKQVVLLQWEDEAQGGVDNGNETG